MYDVAIKLSGLAAFGLLGVGILAIVLPRKLSRSYGVEVSDRAAFVWVRATGARDIILGVILGITALVDATTLLLAVCAAGFVLSLVDLTLAITFARRLRSEHGAHIGGAIVFLVVVALILQSSGGTVRP